MVFFINKFVNSCISSRHFVPCYLIMNKYIHNLASEGYNIALRSISSYKYLKYVRAVC